MNNQIPNCDRLAGYQLIENGVVEDGDMLREQWGDIYPAVDTVGMAIPNDNFYVYRKVPVARHLDNAIIFETTQKICDEIRQDCNQLTSEQRVAAHDVGMAIIRQNNPKSMPTSASDRKALPVATGVLDYFPNAMLAIAEISKAGNEQHHPGEPLHWDKSKSTDHADSAIRHFLQRGTLDTDGKSHSAKFVWRALALLETEIENSRK